MWTSVICGTVHACIMYYLFGRRDAWDMLDGLLVSMLMLMARRGGLVVQGELKCGWHEMGWDEMTWCFGKRSGRGGG